MKKIIVITTGGTIAMRYDEAIKGLVPAVSGSELMQAVPQLKEICNIEVVEFSNIPSPHMKPSIMFELAKKIDALLADNAISGIVITHGTDTVEESAYLADLTIKTDKPVVFTAAMRGASDLSAEGPANILAAVRVAASDNTKDKGVLVVLNDTIHAAREVTKTHTANVATFQSPYWGAIGYVDGERVIFRSNPIQRQKIDCAKIEEKVFLLKAFTGMDSEIFDFLIEKEYKGIVIEGFGRGNLPPMLISGIQKALDKGIVIVLSTRVITGRVHDTYAYEAAVKPVKTMGVITAGELSGQKTRLKLMLLLGTQKNKEEIEKYFDVE